LSEPQKLPETNAGVPALPDEEFVREFTRAQRYVYLFILSQVGRVQDAEEILQDTNLVVWSKSHQFQKGTNFISWSYQIATYEILKFRQKQQRSKLLFNDELLQGIARTFDATDTVWESRWQALEACMQKLHEHDRQLIRQRYLSGLSGKELAESVGRPANSLYQSFSRIRKTLMSCIDRQMAGGVTT
jgi:RNA polymerase sigma-70 factor (ECF subfamily)